jgi:hypothetical protein
MTKASTLAARLMIGLDSIGQGGPIGVCRWRKAKSAVSCR